MRALSLLVFLLFANLAKAAEYYVSSVDGASGDAGTTWALAKATIEQGLALATASGDVVYVDSASNELLTAAAAWDCPTAGTYVSVISVDRNGSTTTGHNGWLAGAQSTMNTSGFAHTLAAATRDQSLFVYGVRMNINVGNASGNNVSLGTATANSISLTLQNCTTAGGASNGGTVTIGAGGGSSANMRQVRLINHNFIARSQTTGASVALAGGRIFISGMTYSFSGANKTATLFGAAGGQPSQVEIVNSDLSGYDKSGGFYFNQGARANIVVRNCKLHATPGRIDSTAWVSPTTAFTFVNVDSGDTKHTFAHYTPFGTLTSDTGIYANDGAVMDGAGVSWKVVTTAACNEGNPFITPYMHRWLDSTASNTVGYRVAHDSATDLHDRNLWSEIEYVSSSTFPQGTTVSNRSATPFDGSATDWTNDSEAWTGIGGFGTQNTQTLSSTFTPSEKSLVRGRLFIGAASKTLYIDPALRISTLADNPLASWTDAGAFNAEPASAGGSAEHSATFVN